MPDLGHVCLGVLGARAYEPQQRPTWRAAAAFSALALLPDVDMIGRAAGFPDGSMLGHRGATHSLLVAVVAGLVFARKPRLAVCAFFTVASHGFFDMMDTGKLGVAYLWPWTAKQFFLPWRFLPGPPPGENYMTMAGLNRILVSTAYFLPALGVALLPRKKEVLDERFVPSDA